MDQRTFGYIVRSSVCLYCKHQQLAVLYCISVLHLHLGRVWRMVVVPRRHAGTFGV